MKGYTIYVNDSGKQPNPNYIPPATRKTPTYDWDWFENHTPFKKILTETCGLEIEKEVHKVYVFAGIYQTNNHYKIKINYSLFANNFDNIKARLLNTNVCKKNKDVFDFVNKATCCKRDLCFLITDGCMAINGGSFEWDWCE